MKGQDLYKRARKLIPGGTQLLSKRPERFLPEGWPSYFDRAKGVEVWDLDGTKYIDMSINGVGACILGAADPDIDAAVCASIEKGIVSTLNCPEEVELAELFVELHPWADKVRFARTGGEAMAIAVRIARAATGKDKIAFCGYHGWHDWYIAANIDQPDALSGHLRAGLDPLGVPKVLKGSIYPFHYNAADELEAIVERHGKELGAIVMEPIRGQEPQDDFLKRVRSIADGLNIPLVIDEISAGFRLTCGGAHLLYDLEPDIAVFAKAIGNGYPMAVVIGKQSVMNIAEKCFISSTNWTERVGPVAAIATIKKHRAQKVHEHLIKIGGLVQEGWKHAAEKVELPITISGMKPMSHFHIDCKESQKAHTLFTQEMLGLGYLASSDFYATFAHTEEHLKHYFEAVEKTFSRISQCVENDSLEKELVGSAAQPGFRRYA